MSYEIIYNRQFIKVHIRGEERYIPLVLYGSNNVTEMHNGRERREREWDPIFFGGVGRVPLCTEEGIMRNIEERTMGDERTYFKRNGKWMGNKELYNFYKRGIKEAKTLEELKEMMAHTVELSCYISVEKAGEYTRVGECWVRSSEELLLFLERAWEYMGSVPKDVTAYVCMSFRRDELVKKAEYRTKKSEDPEKYYVVRLMEHGLVERLTKHKINIARNESYARKFRTKKEAERWVEGMLRKRYSGRVEIEEGKGY